MCAVLDISPKTYYKYRNKEDPDYYDYLIIKEVFDESKGTYGYRRVAEGIRIKYKGVIMNGKKVLRIMKKYNLIPEYVRKSKKKNKNERIEDNVKPNLLNRNFNTDAPNKVWDTDVTYLIFKSSRAYLSTIIDLYDRKVVAYKISKHNDNKLVMDTLNEAIAKRKDVSGLIIHSTKDSSIHLMNTKLSANPMELLFLCLEKVLQLMIHQLRVGTLSLKRKLCITIISHL